MEQQIKELSSTKETFNDVEIDLLQNFLMRVIHGKVCRPNTMAPNHHKVLLIILDAIVSGLSLS
jgi:aminoglycoside phosphotransferase